jgi:hypothetical protein
VTSYLVNGGDVFSQILGTATLDMARRYVRLEHDDRSGR